MSLKGEFYFGKKTLLMKALESQKDKFAELKDFLKSSTFLQKVCFYFTNSDQNEIQEQLNKLYQESYAQPGELSPTNITLSKGNQVFQSISTNNADYIRSLGFFVTVKDGCIFLEESIQIAQNGQPVNSSQCKLLKMLGIKIGKFRSCLLAGSINKGEKFSKLKN